MSFKLSDIGKVKTYKKIYNASVNKKKVFEEKPIKMKLSLEVRGRIQQDQRDFFMCTRSGLGRVAGL